MQTIKSQRKNVLTPFKKDGRERKLCRKKSRSWKSWFEGKTDRNEQCHALLPLINNDDEEKGHSEQRKHRRKSKLIGNF